MARKPARDELELFHLYDIHVPTRHIYMGPETNEDMIERLTKNIHLLESISPDPIVIKMNNIGGDVENGMAAYDIIRNSTCYITIVVVGNAMSMGSIILQAADKRLMYENAKIMIHYGTLALSDHSKNVEKWVESSKKDDLRVEELFYSKISVKNEDITMKKVKKMLEFDTILSAKEALELNLVDEIIKKD